MEIDLAWFSKVDEKSPFSRAKVGFEIETRKKARKYIKGDIFNLILSGVSLGVIVLCERGFPDKGKFEGLFKSTKKFIRMSESLKSGAQIIQVWCEKDIDNFLENDSELRKLIA